jgi:hypothetical protein
MRRLIAVLLVLGGCSASEVRKPEAPVKLSYSSERPGGSADDPVECPRDLSGRSVKTRRVRAIHGEPSQAGTAAYFIAQDPWLAWQRGRELCQREFSAADGVFGESGKLDGKSLRDGATKIMSRDHASSCIACHNTPWRDLGAGTTIAKNAGSGRNTPHVFGGGVLEMLGLEIRQELMGIADTNGDGWISKEEAKGKRAIVRNLATVDFGWFEDRDGDGKPDLDTICYVWYVDAQGKRIPWAKSLNEGGVAGYNFEVQVFGHGQRDRLSHGGIAGTLRAFTANAFDIHSGMQACDPTMNEEPRGDGLARVSISGAQQLYTGATRDRGLRRDRRGVSLDDPDRDGVLEEITEGDLDLAEFYQLNLPRPAELRRTPRRERGRAAFDRIGCASCHVPDWRVERDRRFFDLEVTESPRGELTGSLKRLTPGGPAQIRGIYSDLRHHDLGEAFHELQFDGSVIRRFRTSPLWGLGSTAPYGHDGASLSIDQVIRRHGGEALEARHGYEDLSPEDRDAVLDFLSSLVLYSLDTLPCDVNGDGEISEHFMVAGRDTGRETFNPEWLFRIPGEIEGWVIAPDGSRVFSRALRNVDAAYGCRLPWIVDRDRDGFPDILNELPPRTAQSPK